MVIIVVVVVVVVVVFTDSMRELRIRRYFGYSGGGEFWDFRPAKATRSPMGWIFALHQISLHGCRSVGNYTCHGIILLSLGHG